MGACLLVIPQPSLVFAGFHDDAVKYRQEGYERQWQGDAVGAMTAYRKAATLDPTYATPHNDLGILLEQQERFEEAEQAYLDALKLDPHSREAQTNLAILYERLGQKEKAVYYWLKRSQLGEASDPWVARATQRLAALGVASWQPDTTRSADVHHEQTSQLRSISSEPQMMTTSEPMPAAPQATPPAPKPETPASPVAVSTPAQSQEMSRVKEPVTAAPAQEDTTHTQRGAVAQEMKSQKQSLEDFRSVTQQGGRWP